jgi:hypothetical protein
LHQNYPQAKKKRAPNHSSSPFKEKEKGGEGGSKAWSSMEDSKLGGQWKVPSLVANGRFQAWWPMECSKLGGQWKVKEKPFSPLPFSPQQPLPKLTIFLFDFTILLYHGPKPLLTPSFPFLRSINYNYAPQCN